MWDYGLVDVVVDALRCYSHKRKGKEKKSSAQQIPNYVPWPKIHLFLIISRIFKHKNGDADLITSIQTIMLYYVKEYD